MGSTSEGVTTPYCWYDNDVREIVAFFIAVISLLARLVSGMLAKIHHKVDNAINAQERLNKLLLEGVLVIIAFIILFSWIIPTINS
jgi:heme/copper-type cytochrome/quinol oxidase subunit 2